MSSNGVPIGDISNTVGRKSTHVTETATHRGSLAGRVKRECLDAGRDSFELAVIDAA